MPQIPVDIGLLIIDQCRDDRTSLATCSLVCQAWCKPSRSHLFRKIVIKSQQHITALLTEFTQVLFSSPTSVGSHIEELHLSGRSTSPLNLAWSTGMYNFSSASLDIAMIGNIIPALPRLHTLVFNKIWLTMADFFTIPAIRPSLNRLEINCALQPMDEIRDIVFLFLMFSSIRTLALDLMYDIYDPPVMFLNPTTVPFDFGPLRVNIHSLVLQHIFPAWVKPMYTYIHRLDDPDDPSLQCVSVWPSDHYTALIPIGELVQLAGPTIRSMRIKLMEEHSIERDATPRDQWAKIGILSCRNLRSLAFVLNVTGYNAADLVKRAFQGALEILQLQGLPPLQRVTFHLTLPSKDNPVLTVPDWEYMDQILSYIPSLRSVVISFAAGSVRPMERFGERMARAKEKGQLEFHSDLVEVPWWDVSL